MNVHLNTKRHYEVLDGLRGIAAIIVVIFHFAEVVITEGPENPVGHGFLAVDFFFCLSGFVIGYAYDDRLGKISIGEFFRKRLIRLHPLVVLGSVLGLIAFIFDPFADNLAGLDVPKAVLAFICSLLMIPFPDGIPNRYGNLMPFNAPSWSLFSEYVANIFYVLILWRLPRKWLIPMNIVAAALLICVAHKSGSLLGGWSLGTIWDGFARIFFSFTAGLLVHRYKLIIRSPLGFISLSVLLIAGLTMPYFSWNWLQEALLVMIGFPLLVSLGAGAEISGTMQKICRFSGNISYPLYMTHYMVIWIFANYHTQHPVSGWGLAGIAGGMTILLTGFAYLVLKYYDEPIRAYMSKK